VEKPSSGEFSPEHRDMQQKLKHFYITVLQNRILSVYVTLLFQSTSLTDAFQSFVAYRKEIWGDTQHAQERGLDRLRLIALKRLPSLPKRDCIARDFLFS
jgi:hypothetical protein